MKALPQYLFNSQGEWIAFRLDQYVFDTHGRWIGWLPWDPIEVVDLEGQYLGTIHGSNRLLRLADRKERGDPGCPAFPQRPETPGYPTLLHPIKLPAGASDVVIPPKPAGG